MQPTVKFWKAGRYVHVLTYITQTNTRKSRFSYRGASHVAGVDNLHEALFPDKITVSGFPLHGPMQTDIVVPIAGRRRAGPACKPAARPTVTQWRWQVYIARHCRSRLSQRHRGEFDAGVTTEPSVTRIESPGTAGRARGSGREPEHVCMHARQRRWSQVVPSMSDRPSASYTRDLTGARSYHQVTLRTSSSACPRFTTFAESDPSRPQSSSST